MAYEKGGISISPAPSVTLRVLRFAPEKLAAEQTDEGK
jgi:hypothetical protein